MGKSLLSKRITAIFCFIAVTSSVFVFSQTYTTIVSGQTFTTSKLYANTNSLLIENCIFKDISAYHALKFENCSNVQIRNCTFQNVTSPGDGGKVIWINNSTDVIVDNITIKNHTSTGHPSAILMDGSVTRNVTIQNCNISFVSGNGIASSGTSTVSVEPGKSIHDVPNTGLKVLNNVIHDTGLSPDMTGNSPKHGMYIKAQDCLVEGNTVYNCRDGQCISIRSTGIVRRNKVYNGKSGGINYWAQKPAGVSMKLIIENNLIYQNVNLSSGGIKDDKDVRLLAVNPWEVAVGLKFDDFTVRFNTVIMYGNVQTNATIPVIYIGSNYTNANVYGNTLVDLRTVANTPKYVSVYLGSTSISTLAKNSSNYSRSTLNDFVNPATFDFQLKSTSGALGFANSETDYPAEDIHRITRSAGSLDAGAYRYNGITPATIKLQAEAYNSMYGITSSTIIGSCDAGDWVAFTNIYLNCGFKKLRFRYATPTTYTHKSVELRLDSLTGTVLGSYSPIGTGSFTSYAEGTITIAQTSGVHSLYFKFVGGGGVANFDWFQLENSNLIANAPSEVTAISQNALHFENKIYPNPFKSGELTIELLEPGSLTATHICISDLSGKIIFNDVLENDKISLKRSLFKSGIYIIKIQNNFGYNVSRKLVVM